MTVPALPPVAGNIAAWIRQAATTVNLLIGKATGFDATLTTQGATITAQGTTIAGHTTAITALQSPSTIKFAALTAAPASPAEGWAYYDSTLHKLRVWDGTAWQNCW